MQLCAWAVLAVQYTQYSSQGTFLLPMAFCKGGWCLQASWDIDAILSLNLLSFLQSLGD